MMDATAKGICDGERRRLSWSEVRVTAAVDTAAVESAESMATVAAEKEEEGKAERRIAIDKPIEEWRL